MIETEDNQEEKRFSKTQSNLFQNSG